VSKAFTREDDAGLEPIRESATAAAPQTRMGRARLVELLAAARRAGDAAHVADLEVRLAGGIVAIRDDASVASLGAEVTLRDARGRKRVVRLVTPREVGLVPHGASPTSPIGAAVAGARVGDTIDLASGEAIVVAIAWP
jgi:transcription elongation GreA/GreB family factor